MFHCSPTLQLIMSQELSDVGFVHQAIFLQPSWCVFCFHFVMSMFTYLPDLYINGHNLVLALWFRVSQVYSFLSSRFQELRDPPTKLWGPFTLKFFWNSDIVAEIIQIHILQAFVVWTHWDTLRRKFRQRTQKIPFSGPEI